MTILRCGLAAGIAAVLAAVPMTAHPQSEPEPCATSRAAVEAGRFKRVNLEALSECPISGPAVLAKVWQSRGVVSHAELEALVDVSKSLRDGRVYRSVVSTSTNNSAARSSRLAALRVLTSFYNPALNPSVEFLTSSRPGSTIPRVIHENLGRGAVPLPESRKTEFLSMLAGLSRSEPDDTVRLAALRLRQALAFFDPAHTPVNASTISLLAGCGSRVKLQSSADIALPLRIRVLGASYDQQFVLAAAQDGRSSKLPLGLPKGVVVVSYGGRELARLSDRNAPCPAGMTRD